MKLEILNDGKWQEAPESNIFIAMIKALPVYEKISKIKELDVAWRPISFYPGSALLRVGNKKDPKEKYWFVGTKGEFAYLQGTYDEIATLNKAKPLGLIPTTVNDYLKFFCYFIRGEDGPFVIIENYDDIIWEKAPSEDVAEKIKEHLKPVVIEQKTSNNSYMMTATLLYGDSLFITSFNVYPDGRVEMTGDKQLVSGLKPIV